ncbi:MAG: 23S rRNA (adenine(2030)-N(6))-methyltransferase RlmJ [Pseudomonadota bacterium]
MLSYRHGFHAGNPADVFKHAVLVTLIRCMQEKPAGITFIDTHAGPARYDLTDEWAQKTREYEAGIGEVWPTRSQAGLLQDYLDQVAALNPDGALRFYPGSPLLMAALLREVDRLVICELHPSEQQQLRRELGKQEQVTIHAGDGYEALTRHLPPPTGRGLVLIDPSYELKDEVDTMGRALEQALRRFGHGVYLIWYPMIEGREIDMEVLPARLGLPEDRWLDLQIEFPEAQRLGRMWGTGMALINPPWRARGPLTELTEQVFQGRVHHL